MAENSENKNVRNDEIDLLELFRRLGNWLSLVAHKAFDWLLICIVFILKKSIYLILSILFGAILAYYMKQSTKDVYSSEMVIRSNAVPPYEIISHIDKLHRFCNEGNKKELSGALGLEDDILISVVDIQAFWFIDNGTDYIPDFVDYGGRYNVFDTNSVRMTDRLAIKVNTTAPQNLSEIRDGILRFIGSNKHFAELNKVRLEQTAEMYNRVSYDIIQLDSLQKVIYFTESKNRYTEKEGQYVFLQDQKTELLYEEIQKLYSLRQLYKKQMELYGEVVTIMNDFAVPATPLSNTMTYAKRIVPRVFGLCLLLLVIIHNRKKLFEVYNRYK